MERTLGLPSSALLGKTPEEIFDGATAAAGGRAWWRVDSKGERGRFFRPLGWDRARWSR